jgi:predicted hydrolase (HD superfamily)
MELAEARALVKQKADKEITVRHLISVEGVMRVLARRFGEDQDRWALVGLSTTLTRTAPEKTPRGTPTWPPNGCARPGWRSRWSTPSWPTRTSSTAPT